MKVRVQYTAQLRTATGRGDDDVDLPPESTLAELIAYLAKQGGEKIQPHLLTDHGEPRPSLLIVVNGSAVSAPNAAGTVLHDGDQIILMPPIAGG